VEASLKEKVEENQETKRGSNSIALKEAAESLVGKKQGTHKKGFAAVSNTGKELEENKSGGSPQNRSTETHACEAAP